VRWAGCPAVAIEAGNAAHVDVLAAFLAVLALGLLAGAGGRPGGDRPTPGRRAGRAGGAVLGAAVAVKLYPVLLLPAVLRRRWGAAVLAAATGVVAASYLPHVLAAGGKVVGYLPGYLAEEGYDGTGRFPVIRLL